MNFLIISEKDIVLYGIKQIVQNTFQNSCTKCIHGFEEIESKTNKKISFDVILCDFTDEEFLKNILIKLKQKNETSKIIVFADAFSKQNMKTLFNIGIDGYIIKNLTSVLIGDAISLVLAGDKFIPEQFLSDKNCLSNEAYIKSRSYRNFSPRQIEVIKLVAEGLSNRQIADKMNIKESTIKLHVNSIFKILNVKNRTQALTKASALGII